MVMPRSPALHGIGSNPILSVSGAFIVGPWSLLQLSVLVQDLINIYFAFIFKCPFVDDGDHVWWLDMLLDPVGLELFELPQIVFSHLANLIMVIGELFLLAMVVALLTCFQPVLYAWSH